MTTNVRFMPPRVPLVDLDTGQITREWYRLFQNIMDPLFGGELEGVLLSYTTGVDPQLTAQISSVAQDIGQYAPPQDWSADIARAGQEAGQQPPSFDLSPALAALAQDMGQLPPSLAIVADMLLAEMSGLRDQVAELTKTINDMKQGTVVI